MNQKLEPSGPAPVTLQFNAGDSSPFGHGGCHLRVPPQDVVSAYGLRPYHSATMEGEWRIGEAVSQIGENLARSEHCTDKIKDQEKWPNALFAFDGTEFVLVQRRTAVAYAPTRQQAMDRLAWFSGKFQSAAAPETPSFHIINTSYGSLRAERVEVALNFAPQESNLHWLLLRIFNDGPCTAGHHADGENTAGRQDQPQTDYNKCFIGEKVNPHREKQ
jgi:hypothetical protein